MTLEELVVVVGAVAVTATVAVATAGVAVTTAVIAIGAITAIAAAFFVARTTGARFDAVYVQGHFGHDAIRPFLALCRPIRIAQDGENIQNNTSIVNAPGF